MRFSARSQGFTLLELVVVIGLISVVTAALVPSFNGYIDNQNLRQAQEEIKNDFRSAQNNALTGALSDQPNVKFWGIKYKNGVGSYTFFTSPNTSGCSSTDNERNTDLLPGNTVVRSADGCGFFSLTNGDYTGPSSIVVGRSDSVTGATECLSVTFNSAGLIMASATEVACP